MITDMIIAMIDDRDRQLAVARIPIGAINR